MLAVAAGVASCRTPSTAEPPTIARPSRQPDAPVSRKSAPPQPAPRELELERLLAERDALADSSRTFSVLTQTRPKTPYSVPQLGKFPAPGVATRVVLYAFGRAPVAGCDDDARAPFTAQGTLCGNVVAPGVEVTGEERAKIEALVPSAEALVERQKRDSHRISRAVMRCGFSAHHAVALFDATGSVIAKMLLCFTCGEWIVSPGSEATGGKDPRVMSDEERHTLAEIFDRHGLAAWACDTPLAHEVHEYELETFGTEREPTARGSARRLARLASGSGAPKDIAIRNLGSRDRARLCEWAAREVRPTREPARSRGYACPSGVEWGSEMTEPSCATSPTRCTKTVGEVEACLRVFREPEDLCASPAEVPTECRDLLDCLPGIVRHEARPAR